MYMLPHQPSYLFKKLWVRENIELTIDMNEEVQIELLNENEKILILLFVTE